MFSLRNVVFIDIFIIRHPTLFAPYNFSVCFYPGMTSYQQVWNWLLSSRWIIFTIPNFFFSRLTSLSTILPRFPNTILNEQEKSHRNRFYLINALTELTHAKPTLRGTCTTHVIAFTARSNLVPRLLSLLSHRFVVVELQILLYLLSSSLEGERERTVGTISFTRYA